jgi:suppressor for copper-sensitivity B
LRGRVRYLTCDDICVPYDADVALVLPAGPPGRSAEAAIIARFAAKVPRLGATRALAVTDARIEGSPGAETLHLQVASRVPLGQPDLYVEGPPGYGFGKPRITYREGRRGAVMLITLSAPPVSDARTLTGSAGKALTVTLVDGARAVEQRVLPQPGIAAMQADSGAAGGLLAILALALLGGLILNLMPCVLPVLSLKLLSVVGHGGADPGRVRAGFLASAAGILVSFLVLAGGVVAFKAAGFSVGWGIQFQQPVFLIAMTLIVTLFACNLWGLFEVRLPGAVADVAATAGEGQSLTAHFLTGALATLLATPCTAPFLGTAVGFALVGGPGVTFAVFTALGTGLALPYLAVAAMPRLATALPRPGPWMVTLRRILALALAVTGVWLLTVLATQSGVRVAVLAGVLMATIAAVLGLIRKLPQLRRNGVRAVVAVLAVLAFVVPAAAPESPVATAKLIPVAAGSSGGGAIDWQTFGAAEIGREVALGRVVFVDVTADWCLTCQVNKALVIDRGEVAGRLGQTGVVAMRADWTRPDPRISAFLQRFGRYGIPFNVVFGPGAPRGRVLPELLTTDSVLAALDAAAREVRVTNR